MSCLICGSDGLRDIGPIYHDRPAKVAGVTIDLGNSSFRLLSCTQCGAKQKYPPIPADDLERCYASSPADNWGENIDPMTRQINRFEDMLVRHVVPGRILDIGCSNGAVLSHFSSRWQKYGIEPSMSAAQMAIARGINILGKTIDDVPDQNAFDAVMAIDLVEHLSDPMGFFARVRKVIKRGGILLVFTGDTDATSWAMFGSHHWYCSLPEHIVFLNAASIGWIAQRCGLEVVGIERLAHQSLPFWARTDQAIRVGLWKAARTAAWIPPLKRWAMERRSPYWFAAKDHMLIAMKAV